MAGDPYADVLLINLNELIGELREELAQ